jgi:hypothetical protein
MAVDSENAYNIALKNADGITADFLLHDLSPDTSMLEVKQILSSVYPGTPPATSQKIVFAGRSVVARACTAALAGHQCMLYAQRRGACCACCLLLHLRWRPAWPHQHPFLQQVDLAMEGAQCLLTARMCLLLCACVGEWPNVRGHAVLVACWSIVSGEMVWHVGARRL